MKIILAGASGFIGKFLLEHLEKEGHQLFLLTRNQKISTILISPNVKRLTWDGINLDAWKNELEDADALINLSGENIAEKRWTKERKKAIRDSRVQSTHALVSAIRSINNPSLTFINASAVGYYGNIPEGEVDEKFPAGNDFLAETCYYWEEEALEANKAGVRVILLRIGVVLEKGGGAIDKMLPPFEAFLGGPLGSGNQWFPWIHRNDIANIISFCLKTEIISGPVNAVSPNPLTMKEFSKAFGNAIHRPSWAPVPSFVLRLVLGEMAGMILSGQKVVPKKLLNAGFQFRYPTIENALSAIF